MQLREKKMRNGRILFHLDIYHNKNRWYEFLEIHINKNKPGEADKKKEAGTGNKSQAEKRFDCKR